MDQSFVDVTGIDCQLFDEVTLLGHDGPAMLSLFEVAAFVEQQHTQHAFGHQPGAGQAALPAMNRKKERDPLSFFVACKMFRRCQDCGRRLAASMVCWISAMVWAALTNMASNWAGAR